MTGLILFFLVMIWLLIIAIMVFGVIAWKKVDIYLTYNTRYQSNAYEKAVFGSSSPTPTASPPRITQKKGRSVSDVGELVDLTDIPIDEAIKAIEEANK